MPRSGPGDHPHPRPWTACCPTSTIPFLPAEPGHSTDGILLLGPLVEPCPPPPTLIYLSSGLTRPLEVSSPKVGSLLHCPFLPETHLLAALPMSWPLGCSKAGHCLPQRALGCQGVSLTPHNVHSSLSTHPFLVQPERRGYQLRFCHTLPDNALKTSQLLLPPWY